MSALMRHLAGGRDKLNDAEQSEADKIRGHEIDTGLYFHGTVRSSAETLSPQRIEARMRRNMRSNKYHTAWSALLAAGTAVLIAGCGGGSTQASPKESTTVTTSHASTKPSTRTTSTTVPAISQASSAGKALLDDQTAQGVCDAVLNHSQPPDFPSTEPTTTTDQSTPQITTELTAEPSSVSLSPEGLAVFSCSPQQSGDEFVVGFNLYTRSIKWTTDVAKYSNFGIGTQHLFLVSQSQTPASGLNAGTTSYSLTAQNLDTGRVSWTAALPVTTTDTDEYGDNSLNLTEGPSGDSAHPEDVVLEWMGTSAVDSSNGQVIWHSANDYNSQASGSYVGYGVVEIGEINQLWGVGSTGVNASTGAQLWTLQYPSDCSNGFSNDAFGDQIIGSVEWLFGSDCYFAYDIRSGATIASGALPSSWTAKYGADSFVITPTMALVADGTALSLYKLSDTATPIWSIPGNDVTPLAISSTRVLVRGATQDLFLSISNGSTIGPLNNVTPTPNVVTNGLLIDGDVIVDMDAS
jgi:hypothetical protein